jgi:Cu+-exporting ATPase
VFAVGKMSKVMDTNKNCFHCGLKIEQEGEIFFDENHFVATVVKQNEIFSLNDLTCYYDFEKSPGSKPLDIAGKYDFRK